MHGYTHRLLVNRGVTATRRDLTRAVAAMTDVTGATPRWWRPPYGVASTAATGARLHYLIDDAHSLSAPALLRLVPDLAQRDVYLCGPPRMSGAVRKALRATGLPPEYLHEERFAF